MRWLDLSIAPAGIKRHERRWREGEDAISQKRPLTFHNVSSFFLLLAAVSSTVSHVE